MRFPYSTESRLLSTDELLTVLYNNILLLSSFVVLDYGVTRAITSWWVGKELNLLHLGLQPSALPVELPTHGWT